MRPPAASLPPVSEGVRRARSGAVFSRHERFTVLEIEGPEALSFLDSQLPLALARLEPGGGGYTAYLDAKGRITHDLVILRLDDRFWLLAPAGRAGSLLEKLERYHIRERFEARDRGPDLAVWEFHGPGVPEILNRRAGVPVPPDPFAHRGFRIGDVPVRFAVHPWTGSAGGHLVFPRSATGAVATWLRGPDGESAPAEVGADVLEMLRIEGGQPEFGKDMDVRTLLPELGRPGMVSHDKGCYLGQETVARVHSRGRVNRLLSGVEVEGDVVPGPGTLILRDDAQVGETRSACHSESLGRVVAMAMLRTRAAEPGTVVHLRMPGGLAAGRVRELPFYRTPGPREAAEALYREGLVAFQHDRFPEALGRFERAALMNPHHLAALESLGICYERLGRMDEAFETMEALTRMDPDHIMAWTNLSRYHAQAGRIEDAEKLKGHVTYLVWKREAGEKAAQRRAEEDAASRKARLEERIELFEQVLALDPEDVVANFGLGKVYFDLERWAEAAPRFRKAVANQPSYSMAYNHLGTCLLELGQREEAVSLLRRGIDEAARRGDLMPRREMERKLAELGDPES